jgi:hypothetical protein
MDQHTNVQIINAESVEKIKIDDKIQLNYNVKLANYIIPTFCEI